MFDDLRTEFLPDHFEVTGIGEIGLEVGRVYLEKICGTVYHGTEIFYSFRNIDSDEKDDCRDECDE